MRTQFVALAATLLLTACASNPYEAHRLTMPTPLPPPTAEQLAAPRLAQQSNTSTPSTDSVVWLERPTGMDFAAVYPEAALPQSIGGVVVLDCAVQADGRIACAVASETPEGYGFGEAARLLSARFRMAPHTAEGRPTVGGVTSPTIRFSISDR